MAHRIDICVSACCIQDLTEGNRMAVIVKSMFEHAYRSDRMCRFGCSDRKHARVPVGG